MRKCERSGALCRDDIEPRYFCVCPKNLQKFTSYFVGDINRFERLIYLSG